MHALAAQRKIKWLGTGAKTEAPKALRSETPKVGNGEGVSPSPADKRVLGSVVSSPSRKRFILLFRRDIRPLVAIFVCNSFPSPPPSSTPLRGLNPLFAVSTVLYFKIRVRSGLVSFWARIFWILLRLLISIKCNILSRRNGTLSVVKLN